MTKEEALKIHKCNGVGYSYVDFIKALQILEPGPTNDKSMKAWFVFKDGERVGNILGYKSEKLARKYIRECDDRSDQWFEYSQIKYGKYNGAEDIPEELKKSGIFVYLYSMVGSIGKPTTEGWFISYPVWEKNVWKPYVKEHYKIEEKNFKIVFED